MKNTPTASLFAPSIALLFVLALFVGGHAGAQSPARLMFANQHCSQKTLTQSHESGYLGFAIGTGGIQATLSATETPDSSYFKAFRVTQGSLAPGLNHVLLNTTEVGFKALHGYTHLSQTLDFYWNTFVGFGYTPTMLAVSPESVDYLFAKGGSQYRAVFSMAGEDVRVSFTPVATLVASR